MKLITVCVKQKGPNYFFLYDETRNSESEIKEILKRLFAATDQLTSGRTDRLNYWDVVSQLSKLVTGLEYIRHPLVVDIQ